MTLTLTQIIPNGCTDNCTLLPETGVDIKQTTVSWTRASGLALLGVGMIIHGVSKKK